MAKRIDNGDLVARFIKAKIGNRSAERSRSVRVGRLFGSASSKQVILPRSPSRERIELADPIAADVVTECCDWRG